MQCISALLYHCFSFGFVQGLASGIKVTFQILKAPSVALIHAWMNLSLDFLLLYRITEIIKQGSLIVFTMSSFSLNFQIRALLQKTLFQCILWRIILLRINEGWPGVRQISTFGLRLSNAVKEMAFEMETAIVDFCHRYYYQARVLLWLSCTKSLL